MKIHELLDDWAHDFRYSARALLRERLVVFVVVITLALGLAATTTMFGIVDHLLLRGPAHVVAADDVRRVYVTQDRFGGYRTSWNTGYITYSLLRDDAGTFASVAAYHTGQGRLGRGEQVREVSAGWSTADMFTLLGVQPQRGRFYTHAEDRPGDARHVAVIDHGFWQTEYGGAADVLGRSVFVNDREYTIIGVAPRGFTGPELKSISIWLPLSTGYKPRPDWPTTWQAQWLRVIARTRPGTSAEAAAGAATVAYRAAAAGHSTRAVQGTVSLLPLNYGPAGEEPAEASVARWLFGVSLILLLIATANVVNMLLARVLRRRHEMSVRLALGISRVRLARLLISESLLLAFAGLAGALALTYWGGRAVRLALLPDVQWGTPVGGRMLLFAAAATLVTGVMVSLAPALHWRRYNLMGGLRSGSKGILGRRSPLRAALIVVQVACSVVLLVGAGLFIRSLWNVSRLDLGIDADRVLGAWVTLDETTQRDAFFREAIARLQSHADVNGAVLALGTPLQGGFGVSVRVPGRDSIPEMPGGGPFITVVGPGYFETVGTSILIGRPFDEGEGAGTEPVVIVNETMAHTLWPGEDALTKCLIIEGDDAPCSRVVGIAENARRSGIVEDAIMQFYIPLGQERTISGTQILIRPRGEPTAFVPELRRVLHALDPGVKYVSASTLQRVLDPQIRPWRLGATAFVTFGALALLIAGVGLYSVISYGVGQRRAEIGIRLALGASTRSILGVTLWQGLRLMMIGVVIGVVFALGSSSMLEPLLFQTPAHDALVITIVAAVLGTVAVGASIIPAARAARTDPLQALRAE